VDVRIGIADSSQIIEVDMSEDTDRDELKNTVQAVLEGTVAVLTLEDKRGKELNVPGTRVSFVEIGASEDDRRIGFGA
jgi:hypothetical protein